MEKGIFANWRGDLSGGLASAVMALPGNIIYGLIAFAPLGPLYQGQGILAGIYASVFAGLAAALLGGPHGMISGPRAPTVIVFASVVSQTLGSGLLEAGSGGLDTAVTLGFATVLCSGIMQLLFVVFRLDKMVKYLSSLVIAGVMNGTALLIAYGAFWNCLGVPRQSLWDLCTDPSQIMLPALAVALLSTLLWAKGNRWIPWIPGPLLAFFGGSGLYYGLKALGLGAGLGGTIAAVPGRFPSSMSLSLLLNGLVDPVHRPLLLVVFSGALTIAILSTIESSLAVLTIQNLAGERDCARRELVGQGVGNLFNALFGAIPAGGAASRVLVNYDAGGRTRLSGFAFSMITLLIVLFCSRYIRYIPSAVIAGMSLVVAYIVLDKWSLKLMRHLFRRHVANRGELLANAAIIAGVMAALLYFNIMVAVALGIGLSVFLFVEKMSQSIIDHVLSGATFHSKKQRYFKLMEVLERHGARIAVIELKGAIFFGATDKLYEELERLAEQGVSYVILDMKKVGTVDVSGARVLEQAYKQYSRKEACLVFSYIHPQGPFWNLLKDVGFIRAVKPEHLFVETDLALEYCEECVLEAVPIDQHKEQWTLQEFLGVNGKGADDILRQMEPYLERVEFQTGEVVFREGDEGDCAYVVTEGSAAVTIRVPDAKRVKRLTTLSYGTMFGEIALLDRGLRSATVTAMEAMVCYRISSDNFEKMKRRSPHLAQVLLITLGRFLASHLRRATRTLSELER